MRTLDPPVSSTASSAPSTGVSPALVPAHTYVIPRVHGDPAAARRLAESYREAADEVHAAVRAATAVVQGTGGAWQGVGARASDHPLSMLEHNTALTVGALRDSADALDAYAHKLESAHHHHFFSLHKLMVVAAVVTVTAAAVVVTMGAAAAAEAALAAGAASEATAAAGAAAAAGTGAASGLLESTISLAGVRALLAFAVPHLVQAELSAGFAAGLEEAQDDRLDWQEIGTAAGAGFVGSAGAAQAARVAESVKLARRTMPWLRMLLPHLGQAVAWTGVDAAQQEASSGKISLRELLLTGGLVGAGSATSALRSSTPGLTVAAYNGRQTLDDLLSGRLDLSLHEGDALGHTLAKHVNVTDADLMDRFTREPRRFNLSRFLDRATPETAITEALRSDPSRMSAIFDGVDVDRTFRFDVGRTIGIVFRRDGSYDLASQVVVKLVRDDAGVFIVTAHPELPR
jgi:uncharacterized protein YukE